MYAITDVSFFLERKLFSAYLGWKILSVNERACMHALEWPHFVRWKYAEVCHMSSGSTHHLPWISDTWSDQFLSKYGLSASSRLSEDARLVHDWPSMPTLCQIAYQRQATFLLASLRTENSYKDISCRLLLMDNFSIYININLSKQKSRKSLRLLPWTCHFFHSPKSF